MKFGSVCSGIEAASVAWHPLGWRTEFVSEIDAFPCAVLAHHYPAVPNHGDMTNFKFWPDHAIDVLVGGTPCQSFSVAGLRQGLRDPRGNLMLTFGAIAAKYRPRWLVWENVPGVLSSDGGRDFGAFLGMLGELGYGFAYRVLDAQYFGLAQRRKRVFVVGCLGNWRSAAAVLLERAGLRGDLAPRREARKDIAPTLSARPTAGGGLGTDFDLDGGLIAKCITTKEGNRYDAETTALVAHSLRGEGFDASEDGTGRGTPLVPVAHAFDARQSDVIQYGDQTGPLDTHSRSVAVAIHENQRAEISLNDTVGAIKCAGGKPGQGYPAMMHGMRVRRLTPRECERLQGFPDDYTLIPFRSKPAADGPRYKALGNSMAVPVMAWIGKSIQMVDDILQERAA